MVIVLAKIKNPTVVGFLILLCANHCLHSSEFSHNVFDVSGFAFASDMSRTFRLFYSKVDSGIVSHSYDPSQSPDGLSGRTASSDKQPHVFRGNYHGEQYSELINGPRYFN